jgi:HTH-type transcriptional regulator/antitoxin MqsA
MPLKVEGLQGMRCANCGADPVLTPQIRANQILIADAKRASDGLLSGAQIRELRERLGLSQSRAAEIFGGGVTAFSKYERGQVVQSAVMDKMLRTALAFPQVVSFLQDLGSDRTSGTFTLSSSATETVAVSHRAASTTRAQGVVTVHSLPITEDGWTAVERGTGACNDDYMQLAGSA